MNVISNRAAGKILKGDGFQIAQQAKAAKLRGYDVLDATLGTFYYDDSLFRGFETVKKVLNSISDEDCFSYAPIIGGASFATAVLNWVFREERAVIEKDMAITVIPTPGGTGAISSTVYLTLDPGQTLLISDLAWGPYSGIAANYGINVEKYQLFINNRFNFHGFCEKADAIIDREGKLVVIINDPCHNPTGYTLTAEELENIIAYLNQKKNTPCILLYDVAYLDYSNEGRALSRYKLRAFTEAYPHILIAVAFSASKSFCVYGQRLGAQILMSKNKDTLSRLYQAETFYARHCWSNTNRSMITMMVTINTDSKLKAELDKEIDTVVAELKGRSEIFLSEANECGLSVYPYHSGFFIAVPCIDNDRVLRELRETEFLYFLPYHQSIRLALCAIPQDKIKGIAAKIKKVL
ncbi:MAG: aminotransferase class I/II-fold pyridoxal phosphate-dependent enzyme [Bacilli bacterium]|nr:aminotransferase class I/II-fold pyridoxal phosphate-dependent enzyme [Bacilli bacterium]